MNPTPQQAAIAQSGEGTTLVLAAVGSGKTTTLSERVADALERGIPPERVLALTFTNRAARHMRAALIDRVGDRAERATIGTFHGLCARILREGAADLGLPYGVRVVDEDDAIDVLRQLEARDPRRAWYQISEEASAVPLGEATLGTWASGRYASLPIARDLATALLGQGAVDFAGLVLLTRELLAGVPAAHARWSQAYDLVLVDEVQDTHLSEYAVLRVLAQGARERVFVGDLDQTIYGWRGSAPRKVVAALERDMGPVRRLPLTENFRSTREIVFLADRLAGAMPARSSAVEPHPSLPAGEAPSIDVFDTRAEELAQLATRCQTLASRGDALDDIAVLVRSHKDGKATADAMQRAGVPCVTVEQFQFYRRREVKDALALARLVHDRSDLGAANRVCQTLVRGVGPATLRRIRADGIRCGARLTDLLNPALVAARDPLAGLTAPALIVLDTETTGLDSRVDEVIELAALRLTRGTVTDRFEALLRPTRPVGDSEAVHGISDARLAAEGRDPADVFADFAVFCADTPIAGHNVGFDAEMLRSHAHRVGVDLALPVAIDTLDAARRMVSGPSHRLGDLVEQLGLPVNPTHRAMADVEATVALLHALADRAAPMASDRRALISAESPAFARLAATLDRWAASPMRPAMLIARLTHEALRFKYPDEPERLGHLTRLAAELERMDDPAMPPDKALAAALERAALERGVDALDGKAGVRILTMHQAKGLEFHRVFLPNLVEGALPAWMSVKEDDPQKLDEERRLLYVAITRARRHLHLSRPLKDSFGRAQRPSRYLAEMEH